MNPSARRDDAAEIEARLKLALSCLDRLLEQDELELVRARIARQVAISRQLRGVALANRDEPAPGFDPSVVRVGAADNTS